MNDGHSRASKARDRLNQRRIGGALAVGTAFARRETRRRRKRKLLSLLLVAGFLAVVPPAAGIGTKLAHAGDAYSSAVATNSPLIYYRFDESNGSTATDSSGNGQNGAYGSGTGFSVAGALINSTDTAIQAPSSGWAVTQNGSTLPSGGAARTYEMWFKTTSGYSHHLIETGDQSGHLFNIALSSSYQIIIDGDAGTSATINSPYSFSDGVWHLLDVTVTGSVQTIFYDGQEIGSTALTVNTASGQLLIDDGGGIYPGGEAVDEFAAYGAALSPAQIDAHWSVSQGGVASSCGPAQSGAYTGSVLADSPLTFLRLSDVNAGHGRLALDDAASSGCHAGALASGNGSTAGPLLSDLTSGLQAHSNSDWAVQQSGDNLPQGSADRTYELWFETTSGYTHGLWFSGDQSSHRFNLVVTGGATVYVDADAGTSQSLALPRLYNDGAWHMLDVALHNDLASIYFDGQLTGSVAVTVATTQGAGLSLTNGGGIYPGGEAIADFAAYGSALSAFRIDAHWSVGASHHGTPCQSLPASGYGHAVTADGAVVYYPMTDLGLDAQTRVAADRSSATACQDGAIRPGTTLVPVGPTPTDPGGGMLEPNGENPTVSGSGSNLPTGAASRSFEFWFATQSGYGHAVVDTGDQAANHQFNIGLTSENAIEIISDGGTVTYLTLPFKYDDGAWHQIVVTFDGSTVAGYIDTRAAATSATITVNTPGGDGLWVASGGGIYPGSEDIGEFSAYSGVLSSAQISNHYAAARLSGGAFSGRQTDGGGNVCLPCLAKDLQAAFGFPVNSATGSMWHSAVDLSIPGRGQPLAFSRTYNSDTASVNGPLGYGWQSNGFMSLAQSGGTATITQENASQVTFTLTGGIWTPTAPRFIASLTENGDGSWTFQRQARETFTFNASGQLTSSTDLNGYTTTYTQSGGQLSGMTDASGRTLSLGWTGSHIASITDANVSPSRTVQFQYNDGNGNLTDVIDVNGGHWHYAYDSNHRLTSMLDPNCVAAGSACNGGNGILTHYDSQGRVDWQQDQLGRQTSFDYTSIPSATKVTNPAGNVEVDYYNQGLLVEVINGYGTSAAATTLYAYDPNTLTRTYARDANGGVTASSYDSQGNMLSDVDPLGRQTTWTYNTLNEPLTETDPLGVTTSYSYDARGNVTSVSRPLLDGSGNTIATRTTQYQHQDASHPGDVTAAVDPAGKTTTMSYDAYGDQASVTDPDGNKTTATYNAIGWIQSSVSARGNVSGCSCASQYTTTDSYADPHTGAVDQFGDVRVVTDPLGHTTTRSYDADRNVVSSTDGDGNTTAYAFDLANQAITTTRADTTVTKTDYNADGSVHDQVDGKGNAIQTYGYDSLGRETSSTDALGNVTTYGYDGVGNRVSQQDPGGTCAASPKVGCTTYSYDAASQLVGITYSDGTTPNVSFSYNGDGQRTSMSDGTGTSTWVWDSLGRVTSTSNGNGQTLGFGYDLRGLTTSIAYPGSGKTVTRGYDSAGRWTSVTDWLSPSNSTTFGYDADGNPTTATMPGGVTDQYTFNAADQVTAIADVTGTSGIFSATYGRDGNGQLATDTSQSAAQGSYRYTPLNQLCYAGSASSNACTAPPSSSFAYSFDSADNLTQTENPTQTGTLTQAFNAADELCWTMAGASGNSCSAPPSGATTYGYDARGNRTTAGSAVYGYDQADRLTSANSGQATYAYNGDGQRVSRTVSGTTTQFTWDSSSGVPLLLEQSNPQGVTDIVYGPGGLPLEQISPVSSTITHVGAASTAADPTGTGGQLTLTLPTGLHSGDQIILATTYAAGVNNSSSPPSGYAQATTANSGGTAATADVTQVFRKTASGSETSATITYSGAFPKAAEAVVYRGVDGVMPVDVAAVGSTASGTSVSASATTAYSGDELMLIQGATYAATGSGSWSPPSGMTEQTQKDATTTTIGLADQAQATTGNTGTLTSAFLVSGLTLSGPQLTGSLLALRVPPSVEWFHHDQLGSTRALTDSLGRVALTAAYDPYGNPVGGGPSFAEQISTNLLFSGEYRDSETGFYYLRARYYDPTTAQFLSRDPAVSTTMSPYGYVDGNPLNGVDPTGLDNCGWFAWFCDGVATGAQATGGGIANAWNASGGKVVNTVQNGGLPNGHCIIVLQKNCQADFADNVHAVEASPIGPVVRSDPFIASAFDLAKARNGEDVGTLQGASDCLGMAFVFSPARWTPGQIPARIAGPVADNWSVAASLWNNRRWISRGMSIAKNEFTGGP